MGDAYAETLRELYALRGRGIVLGLRPVQEALSRLRFQPERLGRIVHIAGTNGKGSVAAMVAAGVRGRVGRFTSPHLHSFLERITVTNGEPVGREDIVRTWRTLRRVLQAPSAPALTFFEAVTVMACMLFAERECDVTVLEVGLGGRLDSTNAIDRKDVSVITHLGLDHQQWLGESLAAIAAEKAGILRAGVPVLCAPQAKEALAVVERVACRVGAPLSLVGREVLVRADEKALRVDHGPHRYEGPLPALAGVHQRENAALSVATLFMLAELGVDVDVRAAMEKVRWPARLETLETPDGRYLIDGAHNPAGARALAAHLPRWASRSVNPARFASSGRDEAASPAVTPQKNSAFPRRAECRADLVALRDRAGGVARPPAGAPVLVFGAMEDKDVPKMLATLGAHAKDIVFAAPAMRRAMHPDALVELARSLGLDGRPAPTVPDALAAARRLAGSAGVVVAGSLFLAAEARAHLIGIVGDPPIAF